MGCAGMSQSRETLPMVEATNVLIIGKVSYFNMQIIFVNIREMAYVSIIAVILVNSELNKKCVHTAAFHVYPFLS
jgi:hypothetical protein